MVPSGAISAYVNMKPRTTMILYRLLVLLVIVPATECMPLDKLIDAEPEIKIDNEFYNPGKIVCKTCPTGYYVLHHCTTPRSEGTCEPCERGSYSEGPTGLDYCQTCTPCREDQEEVFSCTRKKNTACQCKSGTYCLPNYPCEICRPCSKSCPEVEVMTHPCNSTADVQCGPRSNDSRSYRLIFIAISFIMVIIILIFILMCKGKKLFRTTQKLKDLVPCKPLNEELPLTFRPGTTQEEQMQDMRMAFYLFHNHVPTYDWEHFMRKLGLTPNEIQEAKMVNADNVKEQHFRMLETWYQKQAGDVNDLLNTLKNINKTKQARTIKHDLVQNGWIVVDTEHSSLNRDGANG